MMEIMDETMKPFRILPRAPLAERIAAGAIPPAEALQIARQIEDVKVLIIDALRHEPHPTHLSVSQALEVAERVRPQQTWLTHICHQLPQSAETSLPPNTGTQRAA